MARAPRVPRRLRGIEPGRAPRSGLDPEHGRHGTGLPGLLGDSVGMLRGGQTRRAAWRRAQARRALAGLLAGVATWLVVSAVAPRPVETGAPVVVAVHDLPLGATVGAEDVRVELRVASQRPGSAVAGLADAVGRVTAGPVGSGELLTTARFRGPAALAGLTPPRVAVSIPLVDDGLLPALRPGDSVTVLTPGTGASVAVAAPVLSVASPSDCAPAGGTATMLGPASSGGTTTRLVVGLTVQEATQVAASMGGASGLTGFALALVGD